MQYKDFKYEVCSKYKNEILIEDSDFCNICYFDLRNLCSDANCVNINGTSLPKNSRFCHLCEHKTIYLINNLLSSLDNDEFSPENSSNDCNNMEDNRVIEHIIDDVAISKLDLNNV